MTNLANSHSLSEFQRNARGFIQTVNEKKEPLILTVNGKIQAVVVDPVTYQELEEERERQRFIKALKEGMKDQDEGKRRPAEEFFEELRAKYDF